MTDAPATISAGALESFAAAVFAAAGMSAEQAAIVARVLVWANLRGVDSHGVQRIPRYIEMIEQGDLNARPAITTDKKAPAAVLVDADRAAGPVAMIHATSEAILRAQTAGIGLAIVRRTTHTAALGYYTQMAAEQGMAAVALAASVPNMIYHGARKAGVSTSPLSIAVPGFGAAPLLLDMATSVVSFGKLIAARKSGRALEDGWAVDAAGAPTIDAAAAALPLPLGGAKGSGLALMFECLTGLIGGNPIIADALTGSGEGGRHRQNALVIAIDIGKFCDLAAFRAEIGRLVAAVRALPRQAGVNAILLPGERGDAVREQRRRDGIPLPPVIWRDLLRVAVRLKVIPPAL